MFFLLSKTRFFAFEKSAANLLLNGSTDFSP
jgi:hypothetical protein